MVAYDVNDKELSRSGKFIFSVKKFFFKKNETIVGVRMKLADEESLFNIQFIVSKPESHILWI